MQKLQLPQKLTDLIDPTSELSDEEVERWLMAPAGRCLTCEEPMARWERLNGGCQVCEPPTSIPGCSCSLNRPHEWGRAGWHYHDDGAHSVAWEKCPAYQRVLERSDPLD